MSSENIAVGFEALSFYRRVVYTALLPFLERDELLAALWIWEDDYASLRSEELQAFVEQSCSGTLSSKHNSILFNLNCHATDKSVALEEDPYRLMVAYRSGRLDKIPACIVQPALETENMKLLSRLLRHTNNLLESDNRYYAYLVREYVDEALGQYQASLSIEQVNELRKWMRDKEGPLGYDYSAKQISSVMNLFYAGACEYFGMDKANQYSALGLKELEKSQPN
ncbi:MAG: hypothetical protein OEX12_10105 [Gammaproteobacteria bacterium]|nr:hypothetical protein [Gammaproteobacteria bacterium]